MMRVSWNDLAKEQLRQASYYILKAFGKDIREGFLLEVRHTNSLLSTNPYLGKTEPLLDYLSLDYRSIVVIPHHKIVYQIKEKHIKVLAFWDTRREPKSLIEDLEESE